VRPGAAALLALALTGLLGAGVWWLFEYRGGYPLSVELSNAAGLRENSDVRIGGVPAGTVVDLRLTERDTALAELRIDEGAAPIGEGARAAVRPANLLGEKYVELQVGDLRRPLPRGSRIPISRTATPVELDDLLNVLDPRTRGRLAILISEAGKALGGRGDELASLLEELPPAFDEVTRLVDAVAADTAALDRAVTRSDRVLASVGRRDADLSRFVDRAAGALDAVAAERAGLARTVRAAPSAVSRLRRTLAALEEASVALRPALVRVRRAAPPLQATLEALPGFARAASPALREARAVAPQLGRLAREGGPVVSRLTPTTDALVRTTRALDPVSEVFDGEIDHYLQVMEGWTRAIQVRDGLGHLFRNQAILSPELVSALVTRYVSGSQPARRARRRSAEAPPPAPSERTARPRERAPERRRQGTRPRAPIPVEIPDQIEGQIEPLLDFLLGA